MCMWRGIINCSPFVFHFRSPFLYNFLPINLSAVVRSQILSLRFALEMRGKGNLKSFPCFSGSTIGSGVLNQHSTQITRLIITLIWVGIFIILQSHNSPARFSQKCLRPGFRPCQRKFHLNFSCFFSRAEELAARTPPEAVKRLLKGKEWVERRTTGTFNKLFRVGAFSSLLSSVVTTFPRSFVCSHCSRRFQFNFHDNFTSDFRLPWHSQQRLSRSSFRFN